MIPPFKVCISSLGKGSGKTFVGTALVRELTKRGYVVSCVKHCSEELTLPMKDTERYLLSGCRESMATSPSTTMILLSRSMSLEELALASRAPIVVAEGFKEEPCDMRIWIARDCTEAKRIIKEVSKIDAIVVKEPCNLEGVPMYMSNDIDDLANLVICRAIDHGLKHVGNKNCGRCGYRTCKDAVMAWLRGADIVCASWRVNLLVDGMRIPLNPFVQSIVLHVVKALIKPLKGVPERPRSIVIEVRDEG